MNLIIFNFDFHHTRIIAFSHQPIINPTLNHNNYLTWHPKTKTTSSSESANSSTKILTIHNSPILTHFCKSNTCLNPRTHWTYPISSSSIAANPSTMSSLFLSACFPYPKIYLNHTGKRSLSLR